MKRKFTKILGVGLTLALLASLLLTAAPVMAAAITGLTVSFTPATISLGSNYTVTFVTANAVTASGDGGTYDIIIAFPLGTTVPDSAAWVYDANPALSDVTVQSTAGFGVAHLETSLATTSITTTPATPTAGPIVNIDLLSALGGDPGGGDIGEGAMVRIKFKNTKVTNPPAIGGYTLTVKTSADTTAVTSPTYTTTAPTILPLPGVVARYNSVGILMYQYGSIQDAIDGASAGDIIMVGPGTYDETILVDQPVTLTGDAATTIIKDTDGDKGLVTTGDGTVTISFDKTPTAAGVVFDGFTVKGYLTSGTSAMTIKAIGVTVQNCVFTKAGTATTAVDQTMVIVDPTNAATTYGNTITNCTFDTTLGAVADIGVDVQATNGENTTISDCTFTIDQTTAGADDTAILIDDGDSSKPVKVTGCTISGVSGIGIKVSSVTAGAFASITDSTFSGLDQALIVGTAALTPTVTVTGCTIDACGKASTTAPVAAIGVNLATSLKITNSAIINGPGEIIEVEDSSESIFMMFNDLSGNAKGIDNDDDTGTGKVLNATHNWWGVATGPAAGMNTAATGGATNNTTAYLGGEATGTFTNTTGAASLLTQTTVGVDVIPNAVLSAGDIIGVANYAANPQSATPVTTMDGGFYDVYVFEASPSITSILLKFYNPNITADTVIYVWGTLAGGWVPCTATAQGVNTFEGYAYVTVTLETTPSITSLTGTPFALTATKTVASITPAITSPTFGADETSVTPTLIWTAIAGATEYNITVSDEPTFVVPLYTATLDINGYVFDEALDYSTTYYWRARAVTADVTSSWAMGMFTTMAEPAEAEAVLPDITVEQPDVTVEAPDAPDIIVEAPDAADITVEIAPDEIVQVIPDYLLWVIVAVGAILVIAVIVLIVRTRRVV